MRLTSAFLFVASMTLFPACACEVDPTTAEEVLEAEGYRDIELTGYAWFACSDDDVFQSSFRARRTVLNSDGTTREVQVEGSLCCGYFKNCTVRHAQ